MLTRVCEHAGHTGGPMYTATRSDLARLRAGEEANVEGEQRSADRSRLKWGRTSQGAPRFGIPRGALMTASKRWRSVGFEG